MGAPPLVQAHLGFVADDHVLQLQDLVVDAGTVATLDGVVSTSLHLLNFGHLLHTPAHAQTVDGHLLTSVQHQRNAWQADAEFTLYQLDWKS